MPTTVTGLDELRAAAGSDLGHSPWRTVDQQRIDTFADATDDHQWIHTEPERAKEGPFGGAIAHGYLTLSLVIPMFGEVLEMRGIDMAVNYGLNKVRFPSPVPVDSRVRLTARLAEVADVRGGVQATVDGVVEIEGSDKPACVLQAVYRYYGD
ncbi:MaoC family dehydratase [Nocardiopsis sp. EMB25]|uniref:MaoC family dehydratase n=1 Tax=Nocardiopsis sp. EMB25 TaxID=2835867 RepID=UPI002284989D|nr:MaoC family dehydratase [Nocardiopsis sp. EMB25]MCY9784245.1 MaoC family dehydratase [Nocardiopsis sp. EMB25]